jgi:hypothetical protein
MQFYRVSNGNPNDVERWAGTLGQAKESAIRFTDRPDVRIELVDLPTDRAAVISMLNNGAPSIDGAMVSRTWRLSPRGALVECTEE